MRESVWSKTCTLPDFETLNENIKTDVLVIGGGLCGLLCAYEMKKAGIHCVLVEGSKIASKITKNTTAKITFQHGLIYSSIIKAYGKDAAKQYLTANQNALYAYEDLAKSIECDFEKKDAYTYSLTDRAKIEEEVDAVKSLRFSAEFVEHTNLPFKTKGSIKFCDQAQFHPLKFVAEITKDLTIYEHTFVREITPHSVKTEKGTITADKIIVATHFPFINKHGGYFLKLYQNRSYVTAYKNAPTLDGMYVDADTNGFSFRNYKDFLLIGGGSHRTGKKSGAWQEIENFKNQYFEKATPQYEWAAQDCMSLDGIPYIGQYGKNTPNLFVATGFNKWGMTSSMVSAMILSQMVQDKTPDYADVFSPSRSMLKPQLFINGFESAKNLVSPFPKRCPHLGCTLKWNDAERSWDCPCHGSRFQEDGTLIDNPATGDAKGLKKNR